MADTSPPQRRPSRTVQALPNALTVARLASLPLFVWVYSIEAPGDAWWAAIIVLIAALTDVADGFIARRYRVQSKLGSLLDPIVDRIFFLVIIGTLYLAGTLPWWAAWPPIVRDIALTVGAMIFVGRTRRTVRVQRLGRAANFVLICGVQWFIIDLRTIGWITYLPGMVLYCVVGLGYAWSAYRAAATPQTSRAES